MSQPLQQNGASFGTLEAVVSGTLARGELRPGSGDKGQVTAGQSASIVIVIRRLAPDEIEVLKELRLSALADAPSAFGATYEQAAAYCDDDWRFRLRAEGHPTFVWEDEAGAQGMVVAAQDDAEPNVVRLFAMWVRPQARGGGAADALVSQVQRWARARSAQVVRLQVTVGNEPAERLYARHGFVRAGRTEFRERDGLYEIEMEVAL